MQLTDAQVMTLAVAMILPLPLLIYSNSRITDAKETLRAETVLLATKLQAEMELLRRDLNGGFTRIENVMRMHVLEHHE